MLTLADLKRYPRVNRIYFLECAANSGMEWRGAQLNGCQYTHGMVHCVEYTGVPLKILLEEAGLNTNAKWLLAEGADSAAMSRSLPLAKGLDDCLVAYRMNGEMLRPEQGYPVRLVVPGWEGNVWVKWLRRIKVGDEPWHAREETSKYTDLLADGRARRFTFVMDAKSVITSPSPQAPLAHKGFTVISGLAWSGRGKVARVDVSLDGGRNWRAAKLDGLVLDKALTRFYAEFDWNGEELLLQSRAIDETGYVQPTKAELRKVRGVNSIYHNNGIQTWHVLRERGGRECRSFVASAPGSRPCRCSHRMPPLRRRSPSRNESTASAAKRLPQEIAGWDIDVRPDGQGLPAGKGSVKDGEAIYLGRCAACHGEFGEGAGRWPPVAGGRGTLASHDPNKTVGSYFPYLSTLFDYTRHAMPFGDSQSLTNDELYAVVAYVLWLNDIVETDFVLSKETWSKVKMPNSGGFHDDDRETTEKAFWNPTPCMTDCKAEVRITGRARALDVTPEDERQRRRNVE